MFGRVEVSGAFEIFNTEFEHVEHVSIENAPDYNIVWPLLLVTAQGEETAVVLDGLVLDQTRVFHGSDVVRLPPEQLGHARATHDVQLSHESVQSVAALSPLDDDRPLGVLDHLGGASL